MKIESLGEEEGLGEFKKSTKVLLIDADTLVFSTCSTLEYAEDLFDESFYSESEYKALVEHPSYDPVEHCLWKIDEEEALNNIVSKIVDMQAVTDTASVELYFTSGKNFRYTVDPMYKANRKSKRYPVGLKSLKDKLNSMYAGEVCTEYEADDIVVYLKRTQPNKYVLAAVDKDVYKSVPGKHWNYYSSMRYNIKAKWVETEIKDAYQFPYIQSLMGDTTDNITGAKGVGKVGAEKAITNLVSTLDMWAAVVALFIKKGHTTKDALRTMRLVNMHQLVKRNEVYKVELWNPPTK